MEILIHFVFFFGFQDLLIRARRIRHSQNKKFSTKTQQFIEVSSLYSAGKVLYFLWDGGFPYRSVLTGVIPRLSQQHF